MKKTIDNFSIQSDLYKKYRPKYPARLYDYIIKNVSQKKVCWDCATGNGQVASELSKYFQKVYATDISTNQIRNAGKKANIVYSIERVEKTSFKDYIFDLVAVGQAVHWFDFMEFNREVGRVSKDGAILAVWGYGLIKSPSPIDNIIKRLYYDIVGPYWDKERKHIDDQYQSVNFDFQEIGYSTKESIKVNWNLNELEGYLNTWSSVQNFIIKNDGENPVDKTIEEIRRTWNDLTKKEFQFPLFIKMWRVEK